MPVRNTLARLAIGLPLLALAGAADAELASDADAEYAAKAITAGPLEVVHDATIVRMANGVVQTLKKGTSEYTCMVMNMGPMCLGPFALEWVHAWQTHTTPPQKLGFIYMLNGDTGMSNTDPWATKPAAGNHWVKTGAHVMVVGSDVKKMTGFLRTPDPDPTRPYVMWAGTPYEHLMLPVTGKPR